MEISNSVKNKAMRESFNKAGTTMYISVPAPSGAPTSEGLPYATASFTVSSNGLVTLSSAIQIAVGQGTKVDYVFISTTPLTVSSPNNLYDAIKLTDDDIKDFDANGIYLINTININIKERV